jgi:tetratricopeptide (TPR) repeat protein
MKIDRNATQFDAGSLLTLKKSKTRVNQPSESGVVKITAMRLRTATSVSFSALVLLATFANGDTIVLKNGRKIVASDITDADGKISYQTPAGEMSIPKSIVDHIDKDDFTYTSAADEAKLASSSVQPMQPVSGYEEVTALATRTGSVNYEYLAQLDSNARSGQQDDVDKDSVAHHAAAQFLAAKGDTASAIRQYEQALVIAPQNLGLLLNISVLHLRQSEFTAALDFLEQARRVAPDSADVAKLEGWAYYGSNKLDKAVAEWQISEKLRPDPDVADALAKAERDKSEEESYREGETAHFNLKYSGGATPDLAEQILRALEDDFNDIAAQLDYTPPEQIGVILYTNQAFADITRAPGWVGALNDGRLRIPVQGLSTMTPELQHVLKHELTHSFIGQKTRQRAPTWLQEGVAQYMEGQRVSLSASALLAMADQGTLPPFNAMEGSWMNLSGNSAALAYAWSLAAVEAIVNEGGMGDVSRLLGAVASAPSPEAALEQALHENYPDLRAQTIQYLQHRYGR